MTLLVAQVVLEFAESHPTDRVNTRGSQMVRQGGRVRRIYAGIAVGLAGIAALTMVANLPVKADRFRGAMVAPATPQDPAAALSGTAALSALRASGQLDELTAAFTAARYDAHPTSKGAVAHNPAQRLQTTFDSDGATVRHAGTNTVRLTAAAVGYGASMRALRQGAVSTHGSRVEVVRTVADSATSVVEWFENRPEGLEQGFTLSAKPAQGAAGDLLRLTLSLDGSLTPQLHAGAQGIALVDAQGATVLRYDHLSVADATGRVMPSHFEVADRMVAIRVADQGAQYPLTIDPLLSQEAYLKASNTGVGDEFGEAVAISGNTVVVGAPSEDSSATGVNGTDGNDDASQSGAAYVFVRSGNTWTQQAYLKASNAEAGDMFGYAVAIDGDTVVVSALLEASAATGVDGDGADNSAVNAGAAYVFFRNGATWSQQAYLKPSNTQGGYQFGRSVSVSGDRVAVGAATEFNSASGVNGNQNEGVLGGAGAVYVFGRSGATWTQEAYVKASNTGFGDNFGFSVALHGATLVVGAPGEDSDAVGVNGAQGDNPSYQDSGAAYVFGWNGTSWAQDAYLKASNTGLQSQFGTAVAISGNTLVVGAIGENSGSAGVNGEQTNQDAPFSGAAYVFVREVGLWSQQAYLKASNPGVFDSFGISVAVDGEAIIVGAHQESSAATGVDGNEADNSANASGAAYGFRRSGATWTQAAYFKASNTEEFDFFGISVGVSGDTVVAGALTEDSAATGVNGDGLDNSAPNAGAAYVFRVSNQPPVANAGPNQNLTTTTTANVTLDGSASSDGNGDTLSYEWRNASNVVVGTAATVNLTLGIGNHVFTLTVDDGQGETDTANVTINVRGIPVITWAPPASIASGTPLSAVQLNASANVPGSFTYTPAAGTVLAVGNGRNLHVDFTPTNPQYNAGAADRLIDVLPAVATNVTGQVSFVLSSMRQIVPGVSRQAARIVLTGPTPIAGPISLVFDNLPPSVTLVGATGTTTACTGPSGRVYVDVPVGGDNVFSASDGGRVTLEFTHPHKFPITYTPRVLAGTGCR